MNMKKWSILFSLSFALSVAAQTTSVTGTMVDSDSTAWAGAKWALSFVPSAQQPNINKYTINGSPLDPAVISQTGISDGSGAFSFSTYQIGAISPEGAQFQLQLCPKASVSCSTLFFSTGSNSSLSLTSAMESNFQPPRFVAQPGTYGYADVEAQLQLVIANTYFNTTSNTCRVYTGSAWASCGSGGGGIGGTVSSPHVPYANGANTLSNMAWTYGQDSGSDLDCWNTPGCAIEMYSGPGTGDEAFINPNQISILGVTADTPQFNATATDSSATVQMNPAGVYFQGSTSGSTSIGVAPVAGTPNRILLPTTTGTAGQILSTNGGNPQQTSWITAGGGIIPPNPANTIYAVIGDSRNLSSTADSTTFTVTGITYASGVVTFTATNNLKAGDWVGVESISSPACLSGVNPYIFQVLSTGLSSSQFEMSIPVCTGSGSGTGGTAELRSYDWPESMANKPFFAGHGSVLNFNPVDGESITGIVALYNSVVHPIMAAAPGKKYLFIQTGYDDIVIAATGCPLSALPGLELGMQGLTSIAHNDGVTVIWSTLLTNSHASDGGSCESATYWNTFNQYNLWVKGQGPQKIYTGTTSTTGTTGAADTHLNVTSASGILLGDLITGPDVPAGTYVTVISGTTITMSATASGATSGTYIFSHGQSWDALADFASAFGGTTGNDEYGYIDNTLYSNSSNLPHFTDAGNELIAEMANETMMNGGSTPKFFCSVADACPNMSVSNVFIANPYVASGTPHQWQVIAGPDYTGNNNGKLYWGVAFQHTNTCQAFGYVNEGIPGIAEGIYDGNYCSNATEELAFRGVSGGATWVMPTNICMGWTNNVAVHDGIDALFCRVNSHEVALGDGSSTSASNATLDVGAIAINTAHVSGHSFDCSGTNCPDNGPSSQSDVTGSRAFGTIFQNTLPRPVYVEVFASGGPSNPACLDAVSDSSSTPSLTVGGMNLASPAYNVSLNFIVLPNNYYQVTAPTSGGCSGNSLTLTKWVELN